MICNIPVWLLFQCSHCRFPHDWGAVLLFDPCISLRINQRSLQLTPLFLSISSSLSQSTRSKAFCQSMKQRHISSLTSSTLCDIILIIAIVSLVPLLHGIQTGLFYFTFPSFICTLTVLLHVRSSISRFCVVFLQFQTCHGHPLAC